MTLPRKPESVKKLEDLVKRPIVVEGYTLETVPGDKPEIIEKLKEFHIKRIEHLTMLASWKRPQSKDESLRKQRDARR